MDEPKIARRAGLITFAELTAGLVWPVLLRSVTIAIHPPRLALGFLTVVCLALVSTLFDLARGADSSLAQTMFMGVEQGVLDFANNIVTFQWILAVHSLVHGVYQIPLETFFANPWPGALLIFLLLPIWATGGGAISRMAAVDLAADLNMSIREALRFALPRTLSLTFSLALPIVFMLVIAGAIKLLRASSPSGCPGSISSARFSMYCCSSQGWCSCCSRSASPQGRRCSYPPFQPKAPTRSTPFSAPTHTFSAAPADS